ATARLDKLIAAGVMPDFAPSLDPAALGYPLNADIHVTLRQVNLDRVVAEIGRITFVLRAVSLDGDDDISCRVAARGQGHLEELTSMILAIDGVERLRTDIALRRRIPHRILPLLRDLRDHV